MEAIATSIKVAIIAILSLFGAEPEIETHYSTIFAQEGDKYMGGESPCLKRMVEPADNVIAHRDLECHTRVLLYNPRTKRETVATVGDHGPYGACIKEGWIVGTPCPKGYWRVKKKKDDPGIWRGAFDLTPHVANKLKHNGFEVITLRVLPPKKKTRKQRRKRNARSNRTGTKEDGTKEDDSEEDPQEENCAQEARRQEGPRKEARC